MTHAGLGQIGIVRRDRLHGLFEFRQRRIGVELAGLQASVGFIRAGIEREDAATFQRRHDQRIATLTTQQFMKRTHRLGSGMPVARCDRSHRRLDIFPQADDMRAGHVH